MLKFLFREYSEYIFYEMGRWCVNKQSCQPSDKLTGNCSLILHSACVALSIKIRKIKCEKMEQIWEINSLFFCLLNTECLNSSPTIQISCLFSSRPKRGYSNYWVFVVWELSCLQVSSLDVLLFAFLWMCMTWILLVLK